MTAVQSAELRVQSSERRPELQFRRHSDSDSDSELGIDDA